MEYIFTSYEVITEKPIRIREGELTLSKDQVIETDEKSTYAGKPCKVIEIPAGTKLWARRYNDGKVHLYQKKRDILSVANNVVAGEDFQWANSQRPARTRSRRLAARM